jgi:predicted nucleic acid-binding protein
LRAFLTERRLRFTSRVATVEVLRAVRRVEGAGDAPVAEAFGGIAIVELDEGLAARAGELAPASMRTLDAIHLASALILAGDVESFVTYDSRLAGAARAVGLAVASPS